MNLVNNETAAVKGLRPSADSENLNGTKLTLNIFIMETRKLTEQLKEIESLMQQAKEIAYNLEQTGDFVTDSLTSRIYDRMLLVDEFTERAKDLITNSETDKK